MTHLVTAQLRLQPTLGVFPLKTTLPIPQAVAQVWLNGYSHWVKQFLGKWRVGLVGTVRPHLRQDCLHESMRFRQSNGGQRPTYQSEWVVDQSILLKKSKKYVFSWHTLVLSWPKPSNFSSQLIQPNVAELATEVQHQSISGIDFLQKELLLAQLSSWRVELNRF